MRKDKTYWLIIFLCILLLIIAGLKSYGWYKNKEKIFLEDKGIMKLKIKQLEKENRQLIEQIKDCKEATLSASSSAKPLENQY
jgi:hypothetical protein